MPPAAPRDNLERLEAIYRADSQSIKGTLAVNQRTLWRISVVTIAARRTKVYLTITCTAGAFLGASVSIAPQTAVNTEATWVVSQGPIRSAYNTKYEERCANAP